MGTVPGFEQIITTFVLPLFRPSMAMVGHVDWTAFTTSVNAIAPLPSMPGYRPTISGLSFPSSSLLVFISAAGAVHTPVCDSRHCLAPAV